MFLYFSICSFLYLFLIFLSAKAKPSHIVFIVADDLGFNDISLHGSPQIPTPNIDALALDGGVDLLNYHAQPVCSPSRSEFMSGRHVITTGIYYPFGQGAPEHLRTDVTLLPEYLKKCCNYSTAMVGKYHLGQGSLSQLPTSRGFDSYLGYLTGAEDHVTHETTGAYDFTEGVRPAIQYRGNWSTQIFADKASEIIRNFDKESSSLFLYLAFQDVHWPLQAPPEYFSEFNGKVGNVTGSLERQWVCAMASFLDTGIGQVVQSLKDANMYDDTLLIFVSDNGGPTNLNEGTNSNNFPMRGGKNTLWEGGTRVNSIIRGPGISQSLISSGKSFLKIHATDWLPTLVKMASGYNLSTFVTKDEPPYLPVDGQDIWEVLTTGDETISPRDWLLLETHPLGASDRCHGDALIVGDMKILKWQDSPIEENLWHPPPGQDPNSVSYTFSCRPPTGTLPTVNQCNGGSDGNSWCLFNITADPCETIDLSMQHPEIVSALVTQLNTYMQFAVPLLDSSGPQPLRMINGDENETVVWTTVDGPCLSNIHCNMNGICNPDGSCSCKNGWTGSKCGVLNLLPIDPNNGLNDNGNGQSSWGGSIVFAEEDGLYHLFYSKFLNNCGLNSWITNSACFHATSTNPLGPFRNETMIIQSFCHNAIIRRAADKTFLLYHIGDGNETGNVKNCTKSFEETKEEKINETMQSSEIGYNTLSYSSSIWGPWIPLGYSIMNGSEPSTDHYFWQSTVTNLAPWPRPDGSVLTIYRGKSAYPINNASLVEQLGIASAPHWRGPYTRLSNLTLLDGSISIGNVTGEDPFLWVDEENETAHVLWHVCCPGTLPTPNPSIISAHAFTIAKDWNLGKSWFLSNDAPYSLNVSWINGTQSKLQRRERPQLFFNDIGEIQVLFNGVVPNVGSDASFTMAAVVKVD